MDRHLHPHHPSKQYAALSSDNFEYDGIEQLKNETVDDDVQGVSLNLRSHPNPRNSNRNQNDPDHLRLAANPQRPQQPQSLANVRQKQFTEANFIKDEHTNARTKQNQNPIQQSNDDIAQHNVSVNVNENTNNTNNNKRE